MKHFLKALIAICAMSIWSGVSGSVVLQIEGGKLVGATNVNIQGVLYDVDFTRNTIADGYANGLEGFQQSGSFSFFASEALRDQVFVDSDVSGTLYLFDSDPSLTFGVTNTDSSFIFTPYLLEDPIFGFSPGTSFVNGKPTCSDGTDLGEPVICSSNDSILGTDFPTDFNFASSSSYVLSTWTISAAPEPTTTALLTLGLLGLGIATRRRRVN